VLPKWYSHVELGAHSYMNDECEVHSFRSPRTVRIGRYSSVLDGDHDTHFASTYPDNARFTGDPSVGNDCWLCWKTSRSSSGGRRRYVARCSNVVPLVPLVRPVVSNTSFSLSLVRRHHDAP
jgi:hypothetical protein